MVPGTIISDSIIVPGTPSSSYGNAGTVGSLPRSSASGCVRAMMLRNTQLFNVTGHPAIAVPMGMTAQGLPCGVELVGRRFETSALLETALACESVLTTS